MKLTPIIHEKDWKKLKIIMLRLNIYDKKNLQKTVEGILYRLKTGCQWRCLPRAFGKWNTIYKAFQRWIQNKKLKKIFIEISKNKEQEWNFLDGSVVKTHQDGVGARRTHDSAVGKSVAGYSSKIHLVVDSFGLPSYFEVSEGQIHDSQYAGRLLNACSGAMYIVADKGYDDESFREQIIKKGSIPLIPRKKNSKIGNNDFDWCIYKLRYLVENMFCRMKRYRAIATRYDKNKNSFEGMLYLACILIWLPHLP